MSRSVWLVLPLATALLSPSVLFAQTDLGRGGRGMSGRVMPPPGPGGYGRGSYDVKNYGSVAYDLNRCYVWLRGPAGQDAGRQGTGRRRFSESWCRTDGKKNAQSARASQQR